MPYLFAQGLQLFPMLAAWPWKEGWCSFAETKQMLYLHGMADVLDRQRTNNSAVLIDQGPIYYLTNLTEFGPGRLVDKRYDDWWSDIFARWANAIDVIVWLDAPNHVLLPRVCDRYKWHTLKGASQNQAAEHLERHRNALTRILDRMSDCAPIQILRYRSDRQSTAQIVEDILLALGSNANGDGK